MQNRYHGRFILDAAFAAMRGKSFESCLAPPLSVVKTLERMC